MVGSYGGSEGALGADAMSATSAANRVLVVDDDPTFVTSISTVIEEMGVLADVSSTGSDALQRLVDGRWSGVLLDLSLPDIHGLEVLRNLRERGDFVPVVIMTGAASVRAAVEATKLGALDFLEKPVRLETLAHSIEQMLALAYPGPGIRVDDHEGPVGSRPYTWHATELVARDLVAVVCAPADSPTVPHWAELLGVSTPVVRARCDLARVRPKACLDLGRIVRAKVLLLDCDLPLSEICACRDKRSIAALLARGGITGADLSDLRLSRLLTQQRFVRHEALIEAFSRNLEQKRSQNLQ